MNMRQNEDGFSLLEVMASMAILVIAATTLTYGMLAGARLTMDAKKLTRSARSVENAAAEGESAENKQSVSLYFEMEGQRMEANAWFNTLYGEDSRVKLHIIRPKPLKGAGNEMER